MGSTTELPRLLVEVAFNVSDRVSVRLTEYGKVCLLEQVKLLDNLSEPQARHTIEVLYEREGAYVFPLYVFMAYFGPRLPTVPLMGARYVLFEGNDVTLLPDPRTVALHRHAQETTVAP